MRTVEQHLAEVLDLVRPLEPIELDLLRAQGGVLAEPVVSQVSLPQVDNSAMDGYAVRVADVAAATEDDPVHLPVIADIAAGDTATHALRDGLCARIMTGAPLPAHAQAVVPVEWTDGGQARVAIRRPAPTGNAIRRSGEDIEAGTTVLRRGMRVGAAEIGVLAAVGRDTALVHPRPRVVVLGTGAELVDPPNPLRPGQIWDSNSYALTAAVTEAGCVGYRYGFVGDDPRSFMDTLEDVLLQADLVVTTGGVSMGAYDIVKEVLSQYGTVTFDRVAMQPGMPQGLGTISESKVPILTLPGNPVSAYVSFYLFVLPALRRMQGLSPEPPTTVRAHLASPVTSPQGRRSYLRAVLEYRGDTAQKSAYTVEAVSRQGSHQLSALAETNALVVVPEQITELPAGSLVETIALPGRE
ncbi:molybdopterin molybdotransferase MoeA [Lipingzhangella sp. LS1_29]|uniref:Molybdopterin molybdenumtransferase n=1 Tax=Lipingzhangella rawalii TaxID=2055835 RepID=A0ABU2H6U5_9ACTN|nr:gephyrin-like molybdotransferase Glp [Lipingzhangella rawalii]MDS1270349.1 molybdopterin molybdotransferase MoeA [Lipingzhangella rawalii]